MIFPALPRAKTSDGAAYYKAGAGRGAPVVLLHGVGLRAESWFPQIRRLRKCRQVFAVDLPGHGESGMLTIQNNAAPALSDFAAAAADFVKNTVQTPAIIVGHSMGALVALALAARLPNLCAGVAALSAVYCRPPEARAAVQQRAATLQTGGAAQFAELRRATLRRWFGENPRGRARRAADFCRQWLAAADGEGYAALYAAFAKETAPADGRLAQLRAPCLFLTGEKDGHSTPEMSRALAKTAPRGEAAAVCGAAHLLQLTHAAEVNGALLAFAKKCEESKTQ